MTLQQLKRAREALKTCITVPMKALSALKDQGELTIEIYEEARSSTKERMEAVEKLNCSINHLIVEQQADEDVMEGEIIGLRGSAVECTGEIL